MLPQKITMNILNVSDWWHLKEWEIFFIFYFDCFWPPNHLCLFVIEGELSPCRHMNGGCGDLCLLTPYGRVNCTCRGERLLLDDNRCVCKSSRNPQILTFETFSVPDIDCNGTLYGLDIFKAVYISMHSATSLLSTLRLSYFCCLHKPLISLNCFLCT